MMWPLALLPQECPIIESHDRDAVLRFQMRRPNSHVAFRLTAVSSRQLRVAKCELGVLYVTGLSYFTNRSR